MNNCDPCCRLAAFRLELRADQAVEFKKGSARPLHAALHRLIEQASPVLSRRIHRAEPKPLSLSPLYRVDTGEPVGNELEAGATVWARLGVLEHETLVASHVMLDRLLRIDQPLILDWAPFSVIGLTPTAPPGMAANARLSYAELYAATVPHEEVTLRFVSPTVFRRKGRNLLHPTARLVFGSYLRRWRAFAPPDVCPADVDETRIEETVALMEADTYYCVALTGHRLQAGFVGQARYRLPDDPGIRHLLATLAVYSYFAGTGARSSFGLGQTMPQAYDTN